MPNLFNRNDGTFVQVDLASLGTTTFPLNNLTKATTADITLGTTGTYFDGPSVAQGSSGTWYASGAVTLGSTTGSSVFYAKLWDGTTVIASGAQTSQGTIASNQYVTIPLSGVLASPASNLKISAAVFTGASNGKILFNATGNSADSFITAVRIG